MTLGDSRRDNLLKVLLIALEFKRLNSPWPDIYEGSEERCRASHALSTQKKFLRGLEQAARESLLSAADWPKDQRASFFQKIREATGLSALAIVGDIEKDVERLLKRKKIKGEDDLRLLVDYVSDYPDGQYFEPARDLLIAYGH